MTSQWCHRNTTHSCYLELNYVENLYFGFFIFWKITKLCRFVTYLWNDTLVFGCGKTTLRFDVTVQVGGGGVCRLCCSGCAVCIRGWLLCSPCYSPSCCYHCTTIQSVRPREHRESHAQTKCGCVRRVNSISNDVCSVISAAVSAALSQYHQLAAPLSC